MITSASTPDSTRPSRECSSIVPITEPTTPAAIIAGRYRVCRASARCDQTSRPLATTPGIAMTTTACSTPRKTAITGMAICGRPPPVAPLMNAPTAIAATMTTRSSGSAPTVNRGHGPRWSRGPVQAREHELLVPEDLRGAPAAGCGRHDDVLGRVRRLVERHVRGDQRGHVEVDVLGHRAHRLGVRRQLQDRHDRVADDVALAGGEQVQRGTAGGEEGDRLGGGRRGVHEVQAAPGWRLGHLEDAVDLRLTDLLDVAEGLLLDGGQAAGDVALGRLRAEQVRLLLEDDPLVLVEEPLELLPLHRVADPVGHDV